MTQLLSVKGPVHTIIDGLIALLLEAGLHVTHTFSLQSAMEAGNSLTGLQQAGNDDGGLEIYLVYGSDPLPATLVAHSYGGRTWLSVVNSAGAASSPELGLRIQSVLVTAHGNSETAG